MSHGTYESVLLQRSDEFIGEAVGVISARKLSAYDVTCSLHLVGGARAIDGGDCDVRGEDMLLDL